MKEAHSNRNTTNTTISERLSRSILVKLRFSHIMSVGSEASLISKGSPRNKRYLSYSSSSITVSLKLRHLLRPSSFSKVRKALTGLMYYSRC